MNSELVIQLIILGIQQVDKYAALYNKAKAENRDVTDAELMELSAVADASGDRLQAWIDSRSPPSPGSTG